MQILPLPRCGAKTHMLAPQFGNVGAAAAVGSCLLLVASMLAVAATVIVRQEPSVSLRVEASVDETGIHGPNVVHENEKVLSEPQPVPADGRPRQSNRAAIYSRTGDGYRAH
jgi:hypothetical protein